MKRLLSYLLPGIVLATACAKSKTDILPGNKPTTANLAASTVRLVHGSQLDLVMNNTDTLTNWVFMNTSLDAQQPQPRPYPTPYFPGTGKLSGNYFLPQQFLDAKGQAIVKLFALEENQPSGQPLVKFATLLDSFLVQEDYNQPKDYYLMSTRPPADGTLGVTVIPRAVIPSTDPTHIRIRLISLKYDRGTYGQSGPVSLAFADGSLVSPVTSGVAEGTWSDYADLPYGNYQFRVRLDGTPKQIPGAPAIRSQVVSETDHTVASANGQYYVSTMTFQPGGAYSLLVSGDTRGGYEVQGQSGTIPIYAFQFITDITPSANLVYARVQGINAAEKNGLHLLVDGADSAIGYSIASGYQTLITGNHSVKVTDGAGKTLAQTTITVKGGDNLSLWVYPTLSGTDSIVTVQNNMGGVRQNGITGDGSDAGSLLIDPLNVNPIVQTRFLNLCPDLPYVTFTRANGTLIKESMFTAALAARNLRPGQPADPIAVPYPYVDLGFGDPGTVEAYQSQPNAIPGNPLTGVPDLTPADFVRMPAYYYPAETAGMEPGVYTVALIGRSRNGEQPKMIVIKHNL